MRPQIIRAVLVTALLIGSSRGSEPRNAKALDTPPSDEHSTGLLEALPPDLQKRVDASHHRKNDSRKIVPYSLFKRTSHWDQGATLRVAFIDGDLGVQASVADLAAEWLKHTAVNLHLDFGYNPQTRTYRAATATDTSEIRISFISKGYWSLVGNESLDTSLAAPGQPTMSLGGFTRNYPDYWEVRRVVLHEFGHALGLMHEHQNPNGHCDAEFKMDDLKAYLGGTPNFWTADQIAANLNPLLNPGDYDASPLDRKSIMFYHFDSKFYINGQKSPCYVEQAYNISDADRAAILNAYPPAGSIAASTAIDALTNALNNPALKSEELKGKLRGRLASFTKP